MDQAPGVIVLAMLVSGCSFLSAEYTRVGWAVRSRLPLNAFRRTRQILD